MGIKLYGNYLSDNAFRVEAVLKQLGLEYEFIKVNLMSGEQKSSEFTSLNSRGQVPTLIDDDVSVVESVAIVFYLQQMYGKEGTSLLPKEKKPLATCLQYIAQFHEKLNPCSIHGSALFAGKTKEDLEERIQKLKTELSVWDGILAEKDYLAGELSLADFVIFPVISSHFNLMKLPPAEFPNITKWWTKMRELPSVSECGYWGPEGFAVLLPMAKGVEFLA